MSVNAYDPTTDSLILLAAGTKKTNTVLTVTTDISRLYGETVTVTDGKETLTGDFSQTGRVTFELANLGTYTITCDRYSTSVNNEDYGSSLSAEVGPVVVSWSTGTDAEIVNLIAAADLGDIDLYEDAGWRVGDERTIHLSAMEATGVGESHAAQDTTWVLMHKGLYKKSSDDSTVNFVVGMKNCLAGTGYMNSVNTNVGSWKSCARRTWCNNVFKNAIPSSIRDIFKQVKVTTAASYDGSTNEVTNDYFFLPAAGEVFKGDPTYGQGGSAGTKTASSNLTEFNAMTRWTWYETASNRIKNISDVGSAYAWWERSPCWRVEITFCSATSNGTADDYASSSSYGLSIAGCI